MPFWSKEMLLTASRVETEVMGVEVLPSELNSTAGTRPAVPVVTQTLPVVSMAMPMGG